MREQHEYEKAAETASTAERRKDRDEDARKQRPRYDTLADENPHICRGID